MGRLGAAALVSARRLVREVTRAEIVLVVQRLRFHVTLPLALTPFVGHVVRLFRHLEACHPLWAAWALTPTLHHQLAPPNEPVAVLPRQRWLDTLAAVCAPLATYSLPIGGGSQHAGATIVAILQAFRRGLTARNCRVDAQITLETKLVTFVIDDDSITVPRFSQAFKTVLDPWRSDATGIPDASPQESDFSHEDLADALIEHCQSAIAFSKPATRVRILDFLVVQLAAEEGLVIGPPPSGVKPLPFKLVALSSMVCFVSSRQLPGLQLTTPELKVIEPALDTGVVSRGPVTVEIAFPPEAPLLLRRLGAWIQGLGDWVAVIDEHLDVTLPLDGLAVEIQWTSSLQNLADSVHSIVRQLWEVEGVPPSVARLASWIASRFLDFRQQVKLSDSAEQGTGLHSICQANLVAETHREVEAKEVAVRRALDAEGIAVPAGRRRRRQGAAPTPVSNRPVPPVEQSTALVLVGDTRGLHPLAPMDSGSLSLVAVIGELRPFVACIAGARLFHLGRFVHVTPQGMSLAQFLLLCGFKTAPLQHVVEAPLPSSEFPSLLLTACETIIFSQLLYRDYIDLCRLQRLAHTQCLRRDAFFALLYRLLPQTRCRSVQWAADLHRAATYWPALLAPDRPAHEWLTDLATGCHHLASVAHQPPFSVLLPGEGLGEFEQPSRGLFVLLLPPRLPQATIYEQAAVFLPCQELAAALVRSPSRHLLLSTHLAMVLLRPILRRMRQGSCKNDLPRTLQVIAVTPRHADTAADTGVSAAVAQELCQLHDFVAREAGLVKASIVTSEWLEQSARLYRPLSLESYAPSENVYSAAFPCPEAWQPPVWMRQICDTSTDRAAKRARLAQAAGKNVKYSETTLAAGAVSLAPPN